VIEVSPCPSLYGYQSTDLSGVLSLLGGRVCECFDKLLTTPVDYESAEKLAVF